MSIVELASSPCCSFFTLPSAWPIKDVSPAPVISAKDRYFVLILHFALASSGEVQLLKTVNSYSHLSQKTTVDSLMKYSQKAVTTKR
jgi:hypothetical protein